MGEGEPRRKQRGQWDEGTGKTPEVEQKSLLGPLCS